MTGEPRTAGILVLEDEWLVAETIRETLVEAGYRVVGPVNSVARALKAMESEPVDLAVLDIWLGESTSFAFAETLLARETPFLFTTGYSAADIPEKFRSEALVSKPLEPGALLAAVKLLKK